MRLRILLLVFWLVLTACGGGSGTSNGGGIEPIDTDGDGITNELDSDDDNDGVLDDSDAFPQDANESADFDGDGIGDNADDDDDNDGVSDTDDLYPRDVNESADFDEDGIGDNADTDDDNDGISDDEDTTKQIIYNLDADIPTATDYLYDSSRNLLFITHKEDFSLSIIDLGTGELSDTISFKNMPERMTMSPDGGRLYVALLVQEHSSYWWEEDQSGYVAVIDIEQQVHENTLEINIDPYDLVVTSGGKLIVSSGSGQWTNIYAYDAQTGDVLGHAGIRQGSRLTMHSSEKWVFAADTDSSPADIERFDISGVGVTDDRDSPYHGDHRMGGDVWAIPNGKYLITRGGDAFLAPEMTFVSSITDTGVYIKQATFDEIEMIGVFVLSNNEVLVINTTTLETIKRISLFGDVLDAHVSGHYAYFMVFSNGITSIVKEPHPCKTCGENTAPDATFTFTPLDGDTTDTYAFDASASSDAEDGASLSYRWDIDNDEVWDTPFGAENPYSHKFTLAGMKYVRLQVKDSGGLTHIVTQNFEVSQGVDSGITVNDSTANELQFDVTAVEADQLRSKAYITDKNAGRLYVVDLSTGLTEKYFQFSNMPERMSVSPDGGRLYVALLVQEHDYYWFEEDQSGYVAVIDLERQAHVNTLGIDIDPYDLVVTGGGKLIVSSGSGQWTDIYAYDAQTGEVLGHAGIRQQSRITLHPSENWVFAADTDSSPADIERFDISGVGIQADGDSPYHGDHRMNGNVWATPDGNSLITKGGDVFLAPDMTYAQSLTQQNVNIKDLSFDKFHEVAFVVNSNGAVNYYNLENFELGGAVTGVVDPICSLVMEGSIFFITQRQGAGFQLTQTTHPFESVSGE